MERPTRPRWKLTSRSISYRRAPQLFICRHRPRGNTETIPTQPRQRTKPPSRRRNSLPSRRPKRSKRLRQSLSPPKPPTKPQPRPSQYQKAKNPTRKAKPGPPRMPKLPLKGPPGKQPPKPKRPRRKRRRCRSARRNWKKRPSRARSPSRFIQRPLRFRWKRQRRNDFESCMEPQWREDGLQHPPCFPARATRGENRSVPFARRGDFARPGIFIPRSNSRGRKEVRGESCHSCRQDQTPGASGFREGNFADFEEQLPRLP